MKAQAALDFMTSYGMALIIIIIAIAIVYRLGVLNPNLVQPSCTSVPGFSCGLYFINTNGTLTVDLMQTTGGTITVLGAACSSAQNSTGNKPAFGNIYVTNNALYYPRGQSPGSGIEMYSGAQRQFNVTCYNPTGRARNSLGAGFFGYIWLNYSVPGYRNTTQEVASLTVRYT